MDSAREEQAQLYESMALVVEFMDKVGTHRANIGKL